MERGIFADRERALENEFFRRVDQKLVRDLREKLQQESDEDELAEETGISDRHVLDELIAVGVRRESLFALSLFPAVYVAWSDGTIDSREREAVIAAAESLGHRRDTPALKLLEEWLAHPPESALIQAWKDYIRALAQSVDPEVHHRLRDFTLNYATRIAQAAGGILGVHSVSDSERAALDEIDACFHHETQA